MKQKLFLFYIILQLLFINAKEGDRSLISEQTSNYRFSDPKQRVICTKNPRDSNFNDVICKKDFFDSKEELNFYIIGDMGGSSLWSPVFPYSTHAQRSVSSAMSELAADDQPAFIINLGDNFYMNGVKNINDERFQKTFEDVYEEKTLGVPWFSIPGNHDYHGNIQAEIDYTNRSTRWTFPGKNANEPWYKIRYEFGAKKLKTTISLDFLMIDTVQLCGMTEDVVGDRIINWVFSESRNSNPHTPIPDKESFAGQQKDWIIGELNKYISSPSSATYVFVAGHYPIYSVGRHGSFYECLKDLDLKMKEAKISAYLSGHDHNLQHLIVENDNKILNYIVSGAGAATDRSQHHWDEFSKNEGAKVLVHYPAEHWWWKADEWFSMSTGGFIQAKVKKDELILSFYSGKGSVCLGNIPVIGKWLGGSSGPQNANCKTLIHQTKLCPLQNSEDCINKQKEEKAQSKAGWLFNGKNLWCLYLC
uniref:Tartrate-resistant acid phosphatase type 5 n=3 Tax=Meloidogyne TaxID=189290 RepID=A0A6V7TLZ7_MELEN|nr:unnamed protein product [Meloidogyne enterolobii]CAD2140309.1 unnamed protein product [Meloidogyne enterolobii]